jgi:hypothetical protein
VLNVYFFCVHDLPIVKKCFEVIIRVPNPLGAAKLRTNVIGMNIAGPVRHWVVGERVTRPIAYVIGIDGKRGTGDHVRHMDGGERVARHSITYVIAICLRVCSLFCLQLSGFHLFF